MHMIYAEKVQEQVLLIAILVLTHYLTVMAVALSYNFSGQFQGTGLEDLLAQGRPRPILQAQVQHQ